jgi:hypothetical protein
MVSHQRALSILSLTNATLLTAAMILLCTEKSYLSFIILIPLSMEKCTIACWLSATPAPSDLLCPQAGILSRNFSGYFVCFFRIPRKISWKSGKREKVL